MEALNPGAFIGGSGGGTPGGSTTQVQFNNAGSFGGVGGSAVGATGDITLALSGAASTPPLDITGTWFTGGSATTTKPQVLIEPTGTTSTGWSTAGTGLGVNAASGFAGRLLDLQLNGTSQVVVTGAGNMGIGTTSPASALTVSAGSLTSYFDFKAAAGYEYGSFSNSSGAAVGYIGIASSTANAGANTDFAVRSQQNLLFCGGGNTERARIDNSGNVLINTTAASAYFDGRLRVLHSATGASFSTTGAAGAFAQTLWHRATTGDNSFLSFGTETTHALRGTITYNRTAGLVAYNTTSDYRAKTIIGNIDNPGKVVDAFRVYRGVMNGATIDRPMLVAHEAQEVAPYCVTGEKDAVDDEGNPIYQQMDHQSLVPLLIAEIQQLRARVAALEAS